MILIAPEPPLSLPECHVRLVSMYGELAPALITLKRWSQQGRLDRARVEKSGAKPRYRYEAVERVAAASLKRPTSPVEAKTPRSIPAPTPIVPKVEDLSASLREVLDERLAFFLSAVESRVASVNVAEAIVPLVDAAIGKLQAETNAAIRSLDHTRMTLMAKYDAADTALRDRNEDLRAANARLQQASTSIDAAKVSARLGQVLESLSALLSRHPEAQEKR